MKRKRNRKNVCGVWLLVKTGLKNLQEKSTMPVKYPKLPITAHQHQQGIRRHAYVTTRKYVKRTETK